MSTRKKAQNKDKVPVKQRSPKSRGQRFEPGAQPLAPAVVIQRARHDPNSLTSRDMHRLQRTVGNQAVGRLLKPGAQRNPVEGQQDNAGLPQGLKAGIETLSGLAMDDVTVHYGSSKPAEVKASAYTQGADIHLAPGQERHLPHEAWHVVQQKEGRAWPSVQWKGIGINVDSGLEREADVMGGRAESIGPIESRLPSADQSAQSGRLLGQSIRPLQRTVTGTPVRQFGTGSGKRTTETEPEEEKKARVKKPQETKRSPFLESNLEKIVERRKVSNVQMALNVLREQRKVETEIVPVQEYTILDDKHTFYHATGFTAARSILEVGFDPKFSIREDWDQMVGASSWSSQGYIYFSPTRRLVEMYGKMRPENDYVIFEFTLPKGTVVTVDPEIPNALRTARRIPPENITNRSAIRQQLPEQEI